MAEWHLLNPTPFALAKAEACIERGRLAELLRRARLYGFQLATWRARLQCEGEAGIEVSWAQAAQGDGQGPAHGWPGGWPGGRTYPVGKSGA